jgi:hypothetical protein
MMASEIPGWFTERLDELHALVERLATNQVQDWAHADIFMLLILGIGLVAAILFTRFCCVRILWWIEDGEPDEHTRLYHGERGDRRHRRP